MLVKALDQVETALGGGEEGENDENDHDDNWWQLMTKIPSEMEVALLNNEIKWKQCNSFWTPWQSEIEINLNQNMIKTQMDLDYPKQKD